MNENKQYQNVLVRTFPAKGGNALNFIDNRLTTVIQSKLIKDFQNQSLGIAGGIIQLTSWEKNEQGHLSFVDSKNGVTWYWDDSADVMWYETTNSAYEHKAGFENAKPFEDWFRQSNYDTALIVSYLSSNPETLPSGYEGIGYQVLSYLILNTSLSYFDEIVKVPLVLKLPRYKREQFVKLKGIKFPGDEENEAKKLGENYLSSDYCRINPLLGAFEAVGYKPEVYRDAGFDFSDKKTDILDKMKAIAVERHYADPGLTETWDMEFLDSTCLLFKQIMGVWGKFTTPVIPDMTVYRGDSHYLYDSLPESLKSRMNLDGTYEIKSETIVWPGIMSTTIGDPKKHNFINAKAIIWEIKVPQEHEGKVIGSNNPSEQEVTFPVATKIVIDSILVRKTDKTIEMDKYGSKAELIIKAHII